MNKQQMEIFYQYFRMVLGVTRKLVAKVPEDKLTFAPAPGQRTIAETIVHMYNFLQEASETVYAGKFKPVDEPVITAKNELLEYMDSRVSRMYDLFDKLTDAHLAAMIESYGTTLPGWRYLFFTYNEHWHHRGAVTVYLRLLGIEPVMIYSYED